MSTPIQDGLDFISHVSDLNMGTYETNLHYLNAKELLIVTSSDSSEPNPDTTKYGIFKFNLETKQKGKWYSYPADYSIRYQSSALNHDKSKLFIFGDPGYVITVDLISGTFTKSPKGYHDGAHCRSLFINGQFHIFGGWYESDKAHYIWNEVEMDLEIAHKFDEMAGALRKYPCLYLKSKDTVLILMQREFYENNLSQRTCTKFEIEANLRYHHAVKTSDERFIICIADILTERGYQIRAIDANTKKLSPNYIDAPSDTTSTTRLVMVGNSKIADCLSSGFVREYSKDFPMDIAGIIAGFVAIEKMYLLTSAKGALYEMNVDDIIKKCLNL